MMHRTIKLFFCLLITLSIAACGSTKRKEVPMSIYSDPLGAYALLKVDYSDQTDSDWIFLGATPVKISKSIVFKNAKKVTLRVIREDFQEQTRTWSAIEFLKQSKNGNKIFWSPAMVKN